MDLSKKRVRVIDNGLFVSFARMLGRTFGTVEYWTPFQSSFPRSQQVCIGDGFEEITRIKYALQDPESVDLWVFLDLYYEDLQLYLEAHGARVWGGRNGGEMELYRRHFKEYLKRINLPVQKVEYVNGIEKLKILLKDVKNKFVKTSFVRGDFETFRHDSYELSEPRIKELEHCLGPLGDDYEFIVEDEVKDAVEVGYDGFCVDGQWPSHAMMAYEVKDCGMLGVALPYEKLATSVKKVNSHLEAGLKGYKYRGFISTEIRQQKDGTPYLIDPCCRLGTPSNELLQELFDKWPETIWNGADGELVSPKQVAGFAALAVVHSEWAVNNWAAVHYPREIDRFVKLRYHTRKNGVDYVAPQDVGQPDLGAVVGTGSTLLDAIKLCKERASQLKGYQLKCDLEAIDKALDDIAQGEKFGIKFGSQPLPSHEQVRKV